MPASSDMFALARSEAQVLRRRDSLVPPAQAPPGAPSPSDTSGCKVLRLVGGPRYERQSISRYPSWKHSRTSGNHGDFMAEAEWPNNGPDHFRPAKRLVPEYYTHLADPNNPANRPTPDKVISPYKKRDFNTDVYNVGTDPAYFKDEKDKQPPRKDPPPLSDPKNPFNRAQAKAMVHAKLVDSLADTGPDRLAGLNSHTLGCIDERVLYEVVDNPLMWEKEPVYPIQERTRGTVLNSVDRKLNVVSDLVWKQSWKGLRGVKALEGQNVEDWDKIGMTNYSQKPRYAQTGGREEEKELENVTQFVPELSSVSFMSSV